MAKKGKTTYLWRVKHPHHCEAPVVAATLEEATQKAAQLWGVPWARVVFHCDAVKETELMPHVCPRCRQYNAYNEEEYCRRCRAELKHEEERLKDARKAYFRREARKAKGEA